MQKQLEKFHGIFKTTKAAIEDFIRMLDPVINHATDEHERLYYHHISEEEEQRLSRLDELIPLLAKFSKEEDGNAFSPSNNEFNRLLQELNLEKFGLHNFVEHLDLALFQFKDDERQTLLSSMREVSYKDYQELKAWMQEINNRFDTKFHDPVAHHDEDGDHLAKPGGEAGSQAETKKKGFTVGSLISTKK